ncbi:MAG: phytoene desaturase family protein [Methylacidiphilales bacterium]|nr:phytoene desaturase family protein [Candidatus Methylacidiphilales bacterium]
MSPKTLVIGAGLGGLAAAIRLARAGHAVEVWEKNSEPGGKARELSADGFRWDMGPSLLTMPHVLRDLFASAAERMEEHLELVRLDSACRYFWTDGTLIDEDPSFWSQPEVAQFLEYARGIYELSGEAYLNRPPGDFWRAFSWRNLGKLRHLGKIATTRTLAAEVERRISDPHLRQIFLRFATYNGSSPYLTPATFNIIPYVEAEFGAWYVRGGMARIAEALAGLAQRNGVFFRFNTTAKGWNGTEATAQDGIRSRADFLVCNGDALSAQTGFLSSFFSPQAREKVARPDLSSSGFILFLGVRGCDTRLGHHNIFFSDDYPTEFAEIHGRQISPREPTIYIAISSRTDPGHAPADHDNYFVLVNAPARNPKQPWTKDEAQGYRDLVLKRLERFGLDDLPGRIVTERIFTPSDFAARDLAHHGALYGWASHSVRTSLVRPPLRAPGVRNVFFAGGTTHPGGGIPLVLLSGKMVADLIQRETA